MPYLLFDFFFLFWSSRVVNNDFPFFSCHNTEFRKTDQSLLVSPDGSSRVPFDPEQKPKFGVLKSPARSLTGSVKKKKKDAKPLKTRKTTPKGRPTAADFF